MFRREYELLFVFMNIIWKGQSFFVIDVKGRENGVVRVAIDPYDNKLGLRVPNIEADILLISHAHSDHSNAKAISGRPFTIDSTGEYEVKDVFVKGISAFHDSTEGKERGNVIVYKIEAEGLKLCHLSDLGQKELSPEQLESIGEVDILMIPVASEHSLDAKMASQIISQIEPRIVIPMHYKLPKLKVNLDGVEKFLKVMGAEDTKPEKKLKITPTHLPVEETKIVVLEI